jgi:hypothetical protein
MATRLPEGQTEGEMKLFATAGLALLLGAFGMAQQGAKEDIKDAGKSAKHAVKKTGKAVKKGTKKGVNKAAEKTEEGAAKVKKETKP